jgi:NAD(P)-dependent dehydrogenase (short-subunit alcohol dehydrogenase family)
MVLPLDGQVAVVTGGAKGMGGAISLALACAGADLVVAARELDALEQVAVQARNLGRKARAVACDVTDEGQVRALAQIASGLRGGRIDILVTVAGVPGPIESDVQDTPLDGFEDVMRVNVTGTFLPIKHVAPAMIARGCGRIITIGSNSGTAGYVRRVGYCASKWAVRGLTRTVALELGRHGITVNCINPGIVDGPRMELLCQRKAAARNTTPESIRMEYTAAQAIPRITTAEDVANAVLFLAGEGGRNITGQDLDIDGGWQV